MLLLMGPVPQQSQCFFQMEDVLQGMERSACIPKATQFSESEYNLGIFQGSSPAPADGSLLLAAHPANKRTCPS